MEPVMAYDDEARFTCGRIMAEPGSVNAIAARAAFTLDTRHPDPAVLDRIEDLLNALCQREAKVEVRIERTLDMPPCRFDEMIARTGRSGGRPPRPAASAFAVRRLPRRLAPGDTLPDGHDLRAVPRRRQPQRGRICRATARGRRR